MPVNSCYLLGQDIQSFTQQSMDVYKSNQNRKKINKNGLISTKLTTVTKTSTYKFKSKNKVNKVNKLTLVSNKSKKLSFLSPNSR